MIGTLTAITLSAAISFSRIGVEQGLSNSTVLSICQAGDGCMWFATPNGLNRFDGYEISSFNSTNSPLPDNILSVSADTNGNVLICTGSGLYRYDLALYGFTRLLPEENGSVYQAVMSPRGDIIYSTADATAVLHRDKARRAGRTDAETSDTLSGCQSTVLLVDGERLISGEYHPDSPACVTSFEASPAHSYRRTASLSFAAWLTCLLKDSGDWFWAGTEGDGLWHFNIATGESVRVSGTSSKYIRAVVKDMDGMLWIGTASGLNVMDIATGTMRTLTADPQDNTSLPDNSVRSLCADSSGGIWSGTYYRGAAYWHPDKPQFRLIRQVFGGNSPNDDIISKIVQDPDGSVWVGTNKGGLNHYDPLSGQWTSISLASNEMEDVWDADNIKAIVCSPDGTKLYVGTHAGRLAIVDKRSHAVSNVQDARSVYSIIKADSTHLWVAAAGDLYLYDMLSGTCRLMQCPATDNSRIRAMLIDKSGNLWLGRTGGIQVFSISKDWRLSALPAGEVSTVSFALCLHESQDARVWVGTRTGVYTIDRHNWSATHYDTGSGMPDNWALGIEEDALGRLWISTAKGLWRLDPETGKGVTYTTRDGLPSNMFTEYAHCRMSDGEMWFGGTEGIVAFRPEQFKTQISTPSPVITGLYVDDTIARPRKEGDAVFLSHKQNSFTIKYSVPDYIASGQDSFCYTMSGLEKKWHDTESHEAVFTHLGKGRYTFRLKATNRDGRQSPVVRTLDIRIVPAWYQTTLIKVFVILLVVGTALVLVLMRIRQRELAGKLEMEQLKRRHREEIGKYKALAFINSDPRADDSDISRTSISKADETLLLKAMETVSQNISNPSFGVEELSASLGMSRSSLHRRIKEITGESALDMIHKMRFTRACELLREGDMNVAQISRECGFRAQSNFTAGFRKYMGCSPSEYASK